MTAGGMGDGGVFAAGDQHDRIRGISLVRFR